MAASLGRLLLLKIGDGESSETFGNACGFKARTMSINNNIVDTSKASCVTPEDVVRYSGIYGIQTWSFSGSGESSDTTLNKRLIRAGADQTALNGQVVIPGIVMVQGALLLPKFEFSGDTEGNMDFTTDITFINGLTLTWE